MFGGLLVADSGGTKTEWRYGSGPQFHMSAKTEGLNPSMSTASQISAVIKRIRMWLGDAKVDHLHFFGAGCGRPDTVTAMKRHLTLLGVNFDRIRVESDLQAAAGVAFGYKSGAGAIIGTGSVAFSYDGRRITQRHGGYGYLLGDETGGITLGKKLIYAYLRRVMPGELIAAYDQFTGGMNSDRMLSVIYQKDHRKALEFLAKQSLFLSHWSHNPWVRTMVRHSFQQFISEQVMPCYQDSRGELAFAGGLANAFQDLLVEVCEEFEMPEPRIIKDPLADSLYPFVRGDI